MTTAPATPRLTFRAVLFYLVHLTPLALLWTGWSWNGVMICAASYVIRMFGVTAGYHRYFSHRAFKASRPVQFALAWLAQMSLQKGVIWWASHHRHHHWHSDKTTDVHSPVRHGFFWSHVGWVLSGEWDDTELSRVRDLTRFPEIVWLDRHNLVPGVTWAVVLLAVFGWEDGLLWGFFISSILLWHGTFTINSLCHVFGRRVYATSDTSRNSAILAAITLGEGWHNNHHFYQRCAAQGWRWYELDPTYLVLRLMQAVRLVDGVGKPPQHVVDKTIDNALLAGQVIGADGVGFSARSADRFQEQVESLGQAADALLARAEAIRTELRELTEWTRDSANARLDALHESAAQLRANAQALAISMAESRDRTLHALHDRVEQIQQTAQAVLEKAGQSPVATN